MNQTYKYKPLTFFMVVFVVSWAFWIAAVILGNQGQNVDVLALLGLLAPSVTALIMIFLSKDVMLKKDFKHKVFGFFRVKPFSIMIVILVYAAVTAISILLSTLFGQSFQQFSFAEDFSFKEGGVMAIITLLLAGILEEIGWRSYGEDSLANAYPWWKATLVFAIIWSLWHLPLFFIPDFYQYEILQLSPWFMVNFLVSIIPITFFFTWLYVKNNRSILVCIIFHLFANFLQEKIAMTPETKCVQTFVFVIATVILILLNKELFFSEKHIGKLLENEKTSIS